MKELSIEEKASKYDEAIEKGKQIQNTPYTAHWDIMKEVAEHLLPELRESEGERIRKSIIAIINNYVDNSNTFKPKMIAWLEKQGEAWSEEDEYYYGIVQYILNNERVGKADKENASNWFKSLKDKVVPQPKQEWSKEDEDYFDAIITKLEVTQEDAALTDNQLKFLKSLKYKVFPQNRWKPSEEMLEALYKAIPENVMAISEDEMLLDKLYQGLKYGRVLSKN